MQGTSRATAGIGMRKIRTNQWIGAAFLAALVIAVAVYALAAPSHRLGMALRATARWSFLWFCLATYGGALTALFGPRFQALARRGRDFGLAYASAHLVHIALVACLFYRVTAPDIPRLYLIVFCLGVFWTYLLALLSFRNPLSMWLGPRRWKIILKIGVEYIAFAYAFEFANRILDGNLANAIHYLPLFAAAVAGPILRLAAAIRRRASAGDAARMPSA
jgi:hypothetical protein